MISIADAINTDRLKDSDPHYRFDNNTSIAIQASDWDHDRFGDPEQAIIDEPMIYGGTVEWTKKFGGSITQYILGEIMDRCIGSGTVLNMAYKGYHPVIDTKSVLLMPGQYPCIPGWHCDGVIRSARGEQPDMSTLNEHIIHYVMALSSIGEDTTQYIRPLVVTSEAPHGEKIWGHVSNEISKLYLTHKKEDLIHTAKSGEVVKMHRSSLHRCPAVEQRQWRYFFRLSFYHMPAMNQFRKQVTVYTDANQGW